MDFRPHPIPVRHHPVEVWRHKWENVLHEVLHSWAGTPYQEGQGLRGVGADCLGFGAGVYDTLHGTDPALFLPRHAQDVAAHNPREAARVTLDIIARWPAEQLKRGAALEPGDGLVVRNSARGGGGHLVIVGPSGATVWHCVHPVGVCYSGLEAYRGRIMYHFRSTERAQWRKPF